MATQYMDYGIISSAGGNNTSPSVPINNTRYTQVYYNTHEGEGTSLSFTKKAFVSFTYDDRKIEDFGLIAVTVNDRLNRETPPEHEDHTTEYKMLHGQYYWGSHYTARELDIALATDGMTQDQLDDFKYWFRAGSIRELVLSQHPNRAIKARVREAPKISVLPFRREKTITIGGETRTINVIEYKGEIELNFVMDEPFWYAKEDILGHREIKNGEVIIVDKWKDVNGNEVNILDTEDALRIVEEDHIPTASMIYNETNLANGLQLINYNERKYTVDSYIDAPIVNNDTGFGIENGKNFQLDGAVVGPITRPVYQEDEKITEISEKMLLQNCILTETGMIKVYQIPGDGTPTYQCFTLDTYLPVKKNSIIKYTGAGSAGIILIATYTLDNDNYILKDYSILNKKDASYIVTENCYIRLTFQISKNYITINTVNDIWSLKIFELQLFLFCQKTGAVLTSKNNLQYFYSGTAPALPEISFSVPLHFNTDGYIDSFNNEYTSNIRYNTLNLQGKSDHKLIMTNPSIFNSYNEVIKFLKSDLSKKDIPSLIQSFRDSIGHIGVRSWIINCINVYCNNIGTSLTTVTSDMQNVLLSWMPYFFVNQDDINLQAKDSIPLLRHKTSAVLTQEPQFSRVNEFITPDGTTIENIDPTYSRFPIDEDKQIKVSQNGKFAIRADYPDSTAVVSFYRWQYYDPATNQWHNLIQEKTQTNRWSGVSEQVLRCNRVIKQDYNRKLRCIISNYANSTQGFKTELTITEINSTLNISIKSPDSSTITLDYGVAKELKWTVGKGQSYVTDDEDYYPTVLYKNQASEQWQSLGESNLQKALDINNLTCTIKIVGDAIKTNTQITVGLYNIATNQRVISDNAIYTITVNRLKIPDDFKLCTCNAETIGQATIQNLQQTNITGFYIGQKLGLKMTGWEHLTDIQAYLIINQDGWNGVDEDGREQITKSAIEYDNNVAAACFWEVEESILGVQISFIGPGGPTVYQFEYPITALEIPPDVEKWQKATITLLDGYPQYDNSKLDTEYTKYSSKTRVTNGSKFRFYVGKISSSSVSINYDWQYKSNQESSFSSIDVTSDTYTISQTNGKYSNYSTLEIHRYDSTTAGQYRCVASITEQYSGLANPPPDPHYKEDITVEDAYCTLTIIQKPSIQYISGKIQPDTIAYYNVDKRFLRPSDTDLSDIKSWDMSYKVFGDWDTIQWQYQEKDASTDEWEQTWHDCLVDGATINKIEVEVGENGYETEFSVTADSSQDLNQIFLTKKYRCIVLDDITQTGIIPDDDDIITFNVKQGTSYITDLQSTKITSKCECKWNWPLSPAVFGNSWTPVTQKPSKMTYQQLKKYAMKNQIQYGFHYDSKSKSIVFTGTPFKQSKVSIPQKTELTANNVLTYAQQHNYSRTGPNGSAYGCAWEYCKNDNQYQTILTIPRSEYNDITLSLTFSQKEDSKFAFDFRLKQNTQTWAILEDRNGNAGMKTATFNFQQQTLTGISKDQDIQLQVLMYYTLNWPGAKSKPNNNNIGYYAPGALNKQETQYILDTNELATFPSDFDNRYWPDRMPELSEKQAQITNINFTGKPKPQTASSNNILITNNIPRRLAYKATPSNTSSSLGLSPLPHPSVQQNNNYFFNCATGEYEMNIHYNEIKWPNGLFTDKEQHICYFTNLRFGQSNQKHESVGDMILSNNLVFEQQNHFGSDNTIQPWSENDKTLSHKLTYDGDIPLQNFKLEYKNYYL